MSAIGLAAVFGGILTVWSGLHRVWVWDVLSYLTGINSKPPEPIQSAEPSAPFTNPPTGPGGALAPPSDTGPTPSQIPLPSGGTLGGSAGGGGSGTRQL